MRFEGVLLKGRLHVGLSPVWLSPFTAGGTRPHSCHVEAFRQGTIRALGAVAAGNCVRTSEVEGEIPDAPIIYLVYQYKLFKIL